MSSEKETDELSLWWRETQCEPVVRQGVDVKRLTSNEEISVCLVCTGNLLIFCIGTVSVFGVVV
ncbi:hypothetical protein E2C01_070466 [Portunus trituberculatus]|uniref:Uncharacterized protein n=1 Tax=Portunus trituberculatus TaxID=210409 RepID=A0A5B7I1N2_PORTR|nr:hypothetical protein [Portunus trituberculatus]